MVVSIIPRKTLSRNKERRYSEKAQSRLDLPFRAWFWRGEAGGGV